MKRREGESDAAFSRRVAKSRSSVCWCHGFWFPHRRGSRTTVETAVATSFAGCRYADYSKEFKNGFDGFVATVEAEYEKRYGRKIGE